MIPWLPLGFAQPLVLLGLLSIPVLWWLLRLIPPQPRRINFPPTRLLFEIVPKQETPSRTPWWLTLLRLTLATIAIITSSGPPLNSFRLSATSDLLQVLSGLAAQATLACGLLLSVVFLAQHHPALIAGVRGSVTYVDAFPRIDYAVWVLGLLLILRAFVKLRALNKRFARIESHSDGPS